MSVRKYPNIKDLSLEIILETAQSNDLDIQEWLKNPIGRNARKLESTIRYYLRNDEAKAIELALYCAKINSDLELTKTAFVALAMFKNNLDIEQLFIDWLVDDNDPHSALHKIADNYWN